MENFTGLFGYAKTQLHIILLQIQIAYLGLVATRDGVRVLVRRDYVDIESGEVFHVWRGVKGFRQLLISWLV